MVILIGQVTNNQTPRSAATSRALFFFCSAAVFVARDINTAFYHAHAHANDSIWAAGGDGVGIDLFAQARSVRSQRTGNKS